MNILLLSGGLDSSAMAAWRRPDVALTIDYGQKPAGGEIAASKSISKELKIRHEIMSVNLSSLGVGPLAGKNSSRLAHSQEWWPFRNQTLITLAAMKFVPQGAKKIIIGAVSTDVHADGKPAFVSALDKLMRFQEGRVRVVAPAIRMTSLDLLKRAKFPRSLLGLTFSCHVMEYACGMCEGCLKHFRVSKQFFGRA